MNVLHAKINVTYTVLRFWEKGFQQKLLRDKQVIPTWDKKITFYIDKQIKWLLQIDEH
jgi:hypothetical protein